MAMAGVLPNIEDHNVNDGADSHHKYHDGEMNCNADIKLKDDEDLPAIRLLVHQQRVTVERQDLNRYCLDSEIMMIPIGLKN